ncbi:MAG: hypothetical protein LBV54_07110 [Puniceicoccales bacterium]|nr:hypothetical protein [Puniceicoccales bacterium]
MLGVLGAGSLEAQSLDSILSSLALQAKTGVESQWVYRGKEHSDLNTQTQVRGEYTLPPLISNLGFYLDGGVFAMLPIEQSACELTFNLGGKIAYENFSLLLGWNYYTFPNKNDVRHNFAAGGWTGGPTGGYQDSITNRPDYNRSQEVFIGLGVDFGGFYPMLRGLSAAVYAYYDLNLKQSTFEADITYRYEPSFLPRAALTAQVFAGYLTADAANGDQRAPGMPKWHNAYAYAGASIDLSYRLPNGFTEIGGGVRYGWNSDGSGKDDIRLSGNTKDNFWWGAWVKFSY